MQEKLEFERWLDSEQREQAQLLHQSQTQKGEILQSMKEASKLGGGHCRCDPRIPFRAASESSERWGGCGETDAAPLVPQEQVRLDEGLSRHQQRTGEERLRLLDQVKRMEQGVTGRIQKLLEENRRQGQAGPSSGDGERPLEGGRVWGSTQPLVRPAPSAAALPVGQEVVLHA